MEPENKAGGGGASNQASGSSQEGGGASAEQDKPLPGVMVPEKASSFKFHPLRCCSDVCYYCGLKFGMLDTPMHIMQVWPLTGFVFLFAKSHFFCLPKIIEGKSMTLHRGGFWSL